MLQLLLIVWRLLMLPDGPADSHVDLPAGSVALELPYRYKQLMMVAGSPCLGLRALTAEPASRSLGREGQEAAERRRCCACVRALAGTFLRAQHGHFPAWNHWPWVLQEPL